MKLKSHKWKNIVFKKFDTNGKYLERLGGLLGFKKTAICLHFNFILILSVFFYHRIWILKALLKIKDKNLSLSGKRNFHKENQRSFLAKFLDWLFNADFTLNFYSPVLWLNDFKFRRNKTKCLSKFLIWFCQRTWKTYWFSRAWCFLMNIE